MNLRKQIIDQSAHFLIAAIILLPVALWPSIATFAYAGACLGLVREATQHGQLRLSGGSLLDTLFWTLGGLTVGVLWGR